MRPKPRRSYIITISTLLLLLLYRFSACQALAWVRYHRVLCPKTVKGSEELVEQLEEEETALKFLQERREKKSKQAAEDKTEKPRAGLTSSVAQMPSEHPILQLEQRCIESRSGHHLLLARVLARFVQLVCIGQQNLRRHYADFRQRAVNGRSRNGTRTLSLSLPMLLWRKMPTLMT